MGINGTMDATGNQPKPKESIMKTKTLHFLDRTTYVGLFVASLLMTSTLFSGVAVAFERQVAATPVSSIEEVVVVG